MRKRTRSYVVAALTLAACLGACEDENALEDSLITVDALTDIFSFSVSGLDRMTGAKSYLWATTGNQVTVDVTSGLSGGSAFLQIRGGDGEVVYAEDIESQIDGLTEESFPGIWQVVVVIEKASGDFSIALARHDTTTADDPAPAR